MWFFIHHKTYGCKIVKNNYNKKFFVTPKTWLFFSTINLDRKKKHKYWLKCKVQQNFRSFKLSHDLTDLFTVN